jgi:hypothetical protein
VIACHAIKARFMQLSTSEQVTATNHQTDLDTDSHKLTNFERHSVKYLRADSESVVSGECFT